MFQILCTLVLDAPTSAEWLTDFHGVSPEVLLAFEPWVHVDHAGVACGCRTELMFIKLCLIVLLLLVH